MKNYFWVSCMHFSNKRTREISFVGKGMRKNIIDQARKMRAHLSPLPTPNATSDMTNRSFEAAHSPGLLDTALGQVPPTSRLRWHIRWNLFNIPSLGNSIFPVWLNHVEYTASKIIVTCLLSRIYGGYLDYMDESRLNLLMLNLTLTFADLHF